MVTGHVKGSVVSRKEAEEHRDRLMEERCEFAASHNQDISFYDYNLCEH